MYVAQYILLGLLFEKTVGNCMLCLGEQQQGRWPGMRCRESSVVPWLSAGEDLPSLQWEDRSSHAPCFAQQLSEVRRQGIAAASCPLSLSWQRDNQWVCGADAVFAPGLLFYQWWLSSVRGWTTLECGENWQDAEIPIYFPSFRSRPC